MLKTWSRTQDSVTLSSAEAELVALSKLAAEVLGVRSMAIEWKVIDRGCTCPLYTDASAALSIAKRQGAGKTRHINVRTLWLQEKAVQEILEYQKIRGEDNPADGLTKHVRQELIEKYLHIESLIIKKDRADASLELAGS